MLRRSGLVVNASKCCAGGLRPSVDGWAWAALVVLHGRCTTVGLWCGAAGLPNMQRLEPIAAGKTGQIISARSPRVPLQTPVVLCHCTAKAKHGYRYLTLIAHNSSRKNVEAGFVLRAYRLSRRAPRLPLTCMHLKRARCQLRCHCRCGIPLNHDMPSSNVTAPQGPRTVA